MQEDLERVQSKVKENLWKICLKATRKTLKKIGYDERSVVIIRPQRAFGLPTAVAAEPGQVPLAKVRSSSTKCLTTAAKWKRVQSVDAGGSGASVVKSKRKSLEDLFEGYKKDFEENKRRRKGDPSIPKMLSPLQHQFCHRKGFEEAAQMGSFSSPLPENFKKRLRRS